MPPPRVPLILAPTPLHRLDRMSRELGIDLWIKRDDLTGFALGGNKGRKLEYLIADALEKGAQVLVSCGSVQSNFIRQLGAACSIYGLKCASATMALPYEDHKPAAAPMGPGGNALLDDLLGIDLRIYDDAQWDELFARAEDIAKEFEAAGKRVYRVPVGGSSPLGAYAFAKAAEELTETFDWIVTASSSGSTQAGLGHALHATAAKVLGIACDPEPEMIHEFTKLASEIDNMTGETKGMKPEDWQFNLDYVGPGYGVPSEAGQAAIVELAQKEGIFLDPIYTGKAFAGLLDLTRKGGIKGKVLFWHTGGTPALFAMP